MKDEISKFSLVIFCIVVGRNLIIAANFYGDLMNNVKSWIRRIGRVSFCNLGFIIYVFYGSTFGMFVICFSRRRRTRIYLRTFIALADLKTACNHFLIVREWIDCFIFQIF